MAIRLSGLTSGMDTDAIVQELVKAYSMKTEKYEKASTKLTWKQDAWKGLNTKIYDLYTKVSNMRFSSAYNLRKTSVSDATKATVTASSNAVTGTQTLKIESTAQASYMTGGKIPEYVDGKEITADSTLEDLGYEGGSGFFKLTAADGTYKKINFTAETKISEVINKLKEAGVNASFDENNRRIYVNAKKSGEKHDFNLIGDNEEGLDVLTKLGLNSALVTTDKDGNVTGFTKEAGNYAIYHKYYQDAQKANKDTWVYLKDLYTEYLGKIESNKTLNETKSGYKNNIGAWEQENRLYNSQITEWQDENALLEKKIKAKNSLDTISEAIRQAKGSNTISAEVTDVDTEAILKSLEGVALYTTDADGNQVLSDQAKTAIKNAYATGHTTDGASLSDADVGVIAGILDTNKAHTTVYYDYMGELSDEEKATTNVQGVTTAEEQAKIDANNALITANKGLIDANNVKIKEKEDLIADLDKDINANNEFMKNNSVLDEVYLATKNIEDDNERQINAEDLLAKMATSADEAAKIYANDGNKYSTGNATKIKGSDAKIILNDVPYTSDSNSFSINGLTINALAKTDNDITINTSIDTQGIYDKVKEFLTEYNNVINEMCKLYNAESASDYEPLTDEEKEAMSDEQIEKWETKIKDSLLRRDTTLNMVMSAMVNTMAQTIEIDGQKLSLSTFGIQTLGFLNAPKNEHYAYHINGDEDDENTSGKEDKLMKAIEENPDQVEAFMKKLSENLYTAIDNKMKSTELSSAYKVYNDKEMDRELAKYAETISKWEEKVKDKEDYYYKQFSNMEVTLSKLQNQTSSLAGLLGQ